MTYLLQVSTSWIVFYGIYLLFLRKETFFSVNRYYLLASLTAGLLIPFLGALMPANETSVEVYHVMSQFSGVEVSPQQMDVESYSWFTLGNILWSIYILGASIVFSRFAYGLHKIHKIYRPAEKTDKEHYTLVESNQYHLPFSFFHFIFISKKLPLNEGVERVLKHEELHANQWHSIDIVFTELLQVFFWFNPILIMYKSALRQSHEYLADAYVTKDHNRSSYGQLLLRQSTSGLEIALANQFFHSQIKKRIKMMYKEKSKRSAMVKYLAALPVLAGMLLIFSSNKIEEDPNQDKVSSSLIEKDKSLESEENGDPIFKVVEEMPRFPGCEDMKGDIKEKENCAKQKMLEFVYSNLKYPKKAKDANVQGMCVIRFIVEKDGSIKEANILRDIGADCGTESLKVVNNFPTWIPGKQKGEPVRVQYTLPVKFLLQGEPSKEELKVVEVVEEPIAEEKEVETTVVEVKEIPIDKDDKLEIVELIALGKPNEAVKAKNIAREEIELPVFGDDVYKVVEKMPVFVGGQEKMLEFIYTNLKYPKEARKAGIDGVAVVQMIIEKDGTVTNVNIARNPGGGTGEEAKRMVESMPDWIPGEQRGQKVRVLFTLPVRYKLEGDNKPKEEIIVEGKKVEESKKKGNVKELLKGKTSGVNIVEGEKSNIVLRTSNYNGPDPLFVIDGKIMEKGSMEELKPDDIQAIQVLKDEKAIKKYGDKGEHGVIEITLKGKVVLGKKVETINEKVVVGKKVETKYLIDGQLHGEDFYNTIKKSHIKTEKPASKEDKFMRGIKGDLIDVNMHASYGYNSAYFPGTNTEDGSKKALLNYVGENLKYPKKAIDNNIEGMVTVHYTVKADGELTNFKIGRSVGWGLDEAVIEMMEKLAEDKGLWQAAYLDRRSVASSMVLPVKFKLQSNQKKEAKTRRLEIDRLDISPNPNNGRFSISYELEDDAPVDIFFYSISGKLLKTIKGAPSVYQSTIELTSVSGQTVLVNIVQNGKIHTNKVIIQ